MRPIASRAPDAAKAQIARVARLVMALFVVSRALDLLRSRS